MNNLSDKRKFPEILAPCGTKEAFYAAVHAGCDACYLAGGMFGARAYAGNFTEAELLDAIDYAHLHGVKVYMTINTLLKESEISKLYEYLLPYVRCGLDAVIVQDLGVFDFIRKHFPMLAIHASTQMNICNVTGAKYIEEMGATRVVTAREMSLAEIRAIREETNLEIETFVHGAMCYSYSGRCLFSSMAGGRSGNRGRCAQTCRKFYSGRYALSMKDMCMILHVPELVEAGIDSFKIEGRMKNGYYVAACVDAYKQMTEDYAKGCFSMEKAEKLQDRLAEVFNRGGFSEGYFFQHNGEHMLDIEEPGNRGVRVGEVEAVHSGKIEFVAEKPVGKLDMLKVKTASGDIELTSNIEAEAGQKVVLNISRSRDVNPGDDIVRMINRSLLDEIQTTLIERKKQIPVTGFCEAQVGSPLCLYLEMHRSENVYSVTEMGPVIQKAEKKPLTEEVLREKLMKTGEAAFTFAELSIHSDDAGFVPVSAINALRREAFSQLEAQIKESFRRTVLCDAEMTPSEELKTDVESKECKKSDEGIASEASNKLQTSRGKGYSISFRYPYQWEAFFSKVFAKAEQMEQPILPQVIYVEGTAFSVDVMQKIKQVLAKKNIKLYVMLPYILRSELFLQNADSHAKQAAGELGGGIVADLTKKIKLCDGAYIRNIDTYSYIRKLKDEFSDKDFVLAASLYGYNTLAISHWTSHLEVAAMDVPRELNEQELTQLSYPIGIVPEIRVYGREELMVSAQCLKNECLEDQEKRRFPTANDCAVCYNVVYNEKPLALHLKNYEEYRKRIDFTVEDGDTVVEILSSYVREGDFWAKEFTAGHFRRGIE